MPQLARNFGGVVDLASVPAEYSAGVGNMDTTYMSYMVYNYAVQQALDIIGTFRRYTLFGEATGNAILTSDPSNPVNGTIPKSTMEIAHTLVWPTSYDSLSMGADCITITECIYRICK
jgi:hypothetical protein